MSENGYDIPEPTDVDDAEAPDDRHIVDTAFLVYITEEGTAVATPDISAAAEMAMKRSATLDDMGRACAEVGQDVLSIKTAQRTVNLFMQAQGQMMEAMKNAEIRKRIGDKLVVPGQ